jgi:hypothetical protein
MNKLFPILASILVLSIVVPIIGHLLRVNLNTPRDPLNFSQFSTNRNRASSIGGAAGAGGFSGTK